MRPRASITLGLVTAALLAAVPALLASGQAASRAKPRPSVGSQGALPEHAAFDPADAKRGASLFAQNCAFCHGKDAGGGESGPDLTRSAFVSADKNGENIGTLLHTGRPDRGMPRFDFNAGDTRALVAFIHSQQDAFLSQTGDRKGVEVKDLQTGKLEAGKAFFNGAGRCATCHDPGKDLKGIASRYTGLALEQRMLVPRDTKQTATVTLANGNMVTGTVVYHDEFSLAVTDAKGDYHSFPVRSIQYKIDDPAHAHVDLLPKYSDADIHDLMAYIQTLK